MKNEQKRRGRKPKPLDRNEGTGFLYIQLADAIRRQINTGTLQPGSRLPSMDKLAERYGVNKATVKRALARLYAAGLIYSVPAQGTYVAERRPLTTFSLQRKPLTVGLVSPEAGIGEAENYHMEIVQGLRDELARYQGNLTLLHMRSNEPEASIVSRLVRAQLDAIVYLGMPSSPLLNRLVAEGPPAFLVDCPAFAPKVTSITMDHRGGATQVMDHLIRLGHQDIVVITGGEKIFSTQERLAGVRDSLARAAIPQERIRIHHADGRRDGSFQVAANILGSDRIPTAFCCLNDEMAVGVLHALQEHGTLTAPKDISITGFDDSPWSTAVQPSLTTVRIDKAFIGRATIQRIWSRFKDGEPTTITVLPATLVVRNSTAAVKAQDAKKHEEP